MKRRSTRAAVSAVAGLILLSLLAIGGAPKALAASGSVLYTFGSPVSENQSNYTLFYAVPPVVHAGEKTNLTFFVYLTALSGWKIESQRQVLRVILNTATQSVTPPEVESDVILYQGGRWGPFNVTLDLNDSQLGLSAGQVTNATVFADLIVYEQYDTPGYPFLIPDGTTLALTGVQVAAASSSVGSAGRLLTSFAVGAVVVGVLSVATLATRRLHAEGVKDGRV